MSNRSELDRVCKEILDWAIRENQLIQWRSHAGNEYLFGFPEFAASETLRQLSLLALSNLLSTNLISLEFEFEMAEVSLRLYDITYKNFEDENRLSLAKLDLLTASADRTKSIIRHNSHLPPYVELGKSYILTSRERVVYLTALADLLAEKRIEYDQAIQSEGKTFYKLSTG